MKVVILGGSGVFGQRMAELLLRDGHDVIIAGRTRPALEKVAGKLGCTAVVADRQADMEAVWRENPEVLVDAAGPFHGYGADPYQLPRAAIDRDIHYFDLADDADFCSGIKSLDAQARAAGLVCYSGMSSVPAISSSVVSHLAQGDPIDAIETAILPGNRAPRGQAVVDSILHQAGTMFPVSVDGRSLTVQSWSRSRRFDLGQKITRRGFMIRVPDHDLFPDVFAARSTLFWAGLEVGVMNHGLALFARLRRHMGFGVSSWLTRLVRRLADWMYWMGTDAGGMWVQVTVSTPQGARARLWRLVAGDGHGPYIPTVAVRAALRRLEKLPKGAGPALSLLSAPEIEAACGDLAVTTDRSERPVEPLFVKYLGEDFINLAPSVRAAHLTYGPRNWIGKAMVSRGNSIWARFLAFLFRFPQAGHDVPVQVIMWLRDGKEVWERRFGAHGFRSELSMKGRTITERFGPFVFALGLNVSQGRLSYPVTGGWFLGIPMPKIFLPTSEAVEEQIDGRFHFDVTLRAPLTRALVVRYQGWLERGK